MASAGRTFSGERKVRLGDADRHGRLRLDALTRYTQDVSDDDTTAAGLPTDPGWVVRSTVVDQLVPASLGEQLRFVTFCSGLGRRWAERRLSVSGASGARYEVATLWVCIDGDTGHPVSLTDGFLDLYSSAADGRKVSARLRNPRLADHPGDEVEREWWQLRASDYDVFGHVNNAAYWSLVEQWLPPALAHGSFRARLEYGGGLPPVPWVSVARAVTGDAAGAELCLWWLEPESDPGVGSGHAAATAAVVPIAPDSYERPSAPSVPDGPA